MQNGPELLEHQSLVGLVYPDVRDLTMFQYSLALSIASQVTLDDSWVFKAGKDQERKSFSLRAKAFLVDHWEWRTT